MVTLRRKLLSSSALVFVLLVRDEGYQQQLQHSFMPNYAFNIPRLNAKSRHGEKSSNKGT